MPSAAADDWYENRKFVLSCLEDLSNRLESLDKKIDDKFDHMDSKLQPISLDINGLKVKAGVVGFLTGLIAPFITLAFMLFKQLFSNTNH